MDAVLIALAVAALASALTLLVRGGESATGPRVRHRI